MVCTACTATYKPTLPITLSMAVALINAFVEEHQACGSRKTGTTQP